MALGIDDELTPYGLRHRFALRLGIDLGLSIREAAELITEDDRESEVTRSR